MYPWPFGEFDNVMDEALDIAMDYLIRTGQAVRFREVQKTAADSIACAWWAGVRNGVDSPTWQLGLWNTNSLYTGRAANGSKFARTTMSRGHGDGAQSSRFVSFFDFCFAASRAQPAIPALFLKRFGSCSGVALVKAANSRARDHLLFCFGSKAGQVASIRVLTGLVLFLRGVLNASATRRDIVFETPRSLHSL